MSPDLQSRTDYHPNALDFAASHFVLPDAAMVETSLPVPDRGSEGFIAGSKDATALDIPESLPVAGEVVLDLPSAIRHLGAAAMKQLELVKDYGPTAYLAVRLGAVASRIGQIAKAHPKIVAAGVGVTAGVFGTKLSIDSMHQTVVANVDHATLTSAHLPTRHLSFHGHAPRRMQHGNPTAHPKQPKPNLSAPAAKGGSRFWEDVKVYGTIGAATAIGGLLLNRVLRKPGEANPAETYVPIRGAATSSLRHSLLANGAVGVIGNHGAPVAQDGNDPNVLYPKIGTADFSTLAPMTITAHTSPQQPRVITLRLSVGDGRRIGTPLVESRTQNRLTGPHPDIGYVALTCTVDESADKPDYVLYGEKEDGDLDALPLTPGSTRYYISLLSGILEEDVYKLTAKKRKTRRQAATKATLELPD